MRSHPQFAAWAALLSVCFFWGTTYLGIRMALEGFPPMVLVGLRYLLSGSIMLLGALLLHAHIPRGRELWRTALNGVLVLGIGNTCLTFAETWIPSGLAALIITVSPFWMVGLDALLPRGERLHLPTLAGMGVGLIGAVLLVGPGALHAGFSSGTVKGFLLLQLGCAGWCLGSLVQRHQKCVAHPVVSGAVQQLATGVVLSAGTLIFPQPPVVFSWRAAGAVAYLVVFGTIVGYSSYVYAMDKLPVALVSLHNYVNPVVAVILGWLVYREPFGWREAAAMTIIFGGVAFVRRFHRAGK